MYGSGSAGPATVGRYDRWPLHVSGCLNDWWPLIVYVWGTGVDGMDLGWGIGIGNTVASVYQTACVCVCCSLRLYGIPGSHTSYTVHLTCD